MDNVIKLISYTQERDEYGVDRKAYHAREVFCKVNSTTRSEFFQGGRNGLNPSYEFTVFKGEYNGETIVEYEGLTYAVYRTYIEDDDYIELYVERQGGTNGKQTS